MSTLDLLLWDVLPYVTITAFVVGVVWRYRYDKFGWTTRSSQLYERSVLRIASPLFHVGLLAVAGGHVVGLLIPASWTAAWGLSDDAYHALALGFGLLAGVSTVVGLVLLIYRRRTRTAVFRETTPNDKTMYVFLGAAIGLGMLATLSGAGVLGEEHNYRATVSPWFRSILLLRPDGALMADVPASFQLHAVAGMLLFIIWPFTRLVHAFSAPIGYLFRPYVIYRTRESQPTRDRLGV